jgi:glycosyltransferase involved in cell wall biosynthesis
LTRADSVVVPSGFLAGVFRRRGIPVHVVPNVIDLDRFRPRPRRDPGRAPHLLIARNLERIYDIPTGLRAFAIIRKTFPGARLTMAGTGPLRTDLEHLTAELGLTDAVVFTGRLDNERMASLYQSVDLVLNPTRVDNMPISVLEALASGVPVVSTDVGGIPFVVDHGRTGLLVAPGDPKVMAAAASRILQTPGLAVEFRNAGIAAMAQYTWPVVGPQLLAVYTEVLRRRTVAPAPGETV